MEQPIVHYKDNRQPPLTGQILNDGIPVNLTGATVKLQMRAENSSTLKVDAAAVIDIAASGNVHYDWAALDVDTAGMYAAWWRVTAGGQFEDTPEFPVEIRAHAPVAYVGVEELKKSLSLTGESYADADIARALEAASNVVDELTGSGPFTLTTEARKFTPVSDVYLRVGPVSTITAFTQDSTTWVEGTDFYVDGGDTIRILNGKRFTRAPQAVTISASWGYATVPAEIKEAVQIIATQLLRRAREAPFGILATSLDGPAIRLGRFDPQVDALLIRYKVTPMIE
jgi:BppU N-terminal domain